MPSATRGSQKNSARQRFDDGNAHGDGGAAEAPPMGTSEDHGGSQTEISDHANDPLAIGGPFDDGDTGSDAEALPTETSEDPLSDPRLPQPRLGNAILESQMAAMGAALAEALTSTLAQMQATQDRRDAALQERIALLTAALARGTPPAFTPEQLQESRGGVTAGAAGDAPSPPEYPPHPGAGAAEGTMNYPDPLRVAGEPPAAPITHDLCHKSGSHYVDQHN